MWNEGIAPDGTRLILCGLSYKDVISCGGMSQKDAAKKLGVNYKHFNQVVKRHGLSHWFPKPKQIFTPTVSKEDIEQTAAEGYTQKDAAFLLGLCDRRLKVLIARWNLNSQFPSSGKAAWISRRGYAE